MQRMFKRRKEVSVFKRLNPIFETAYEESKGNREAPSRYRYTGATSRGNFNHRILEKRWQLFMKGNMKRPTSKKKFQKSFLVWIQCCYHRSTENERIIWNLRCFLQTTTAGIFAHCFSPLAQQARILLQIVQLAVHWIEAACSFYSTRKFLLLSFFLSFFLFFTDW